MVTCHFCRAPAEYHCTQPHEERRIAMPAEVRRHDFIQDSLDLQFYIVDGIQLPLQPETFAAEFTLLMHGKRVNKLYRMGIPLLWLDVIECGNPACEAHCLDLGDDKHFRCADHWKLAGEPIG